jgi:hypothetical protein
MASETQPTWKTAAILVGRLIFAGVFIMAVTFKFAKYRWHGRLHRIGRLRATSITVILVYAKS